MIHTLFQKPRPPKFMNVHFQGNTTNNDTPVFPLLFLVLYLAGTRPLLLIGWNSVACLSPRHFLCFPVYTARAVFKHQVLFSAHTQNRQLADREEVVAEFDKQCVGLESVTAPLIHTVIIYVEFDSNEL